MLLISLERNVCLSEPRLNSVSFVANPVVLQKGNNQSHKQEQWFLGTHEVNWIKSQQVNYLV